MRITQSQLVSCTVLGVLIALAGGAGAAPVGTSFTYQGVLSDAGTPVAGARDFRFTLYDAAAGGGVLGGPVEVGDVAVDEGRFTVELDLGDVFHGTAGWLEIAVRDGASSGPYTVLTPRQPLTATPNAQHAERADLAANATRLNGQAPSFYLDWANLAHVPADLADGDDDTLAGLSCDPSQIALWNGTRWRCSADDDTPYVRTFVIGPVGDPAANGSALLAAFAAIPPPANQDDPVLVKLEPGRYYLPDGELLALAPWMVLEGSGTPSGTNAPTRVEGSHCGASFAESGIVVGAEGASLSNVGVHNYCDEASSYSAAVVNEASQFSAHDVLMWALPGAYKSAGLFNSGWGMRLTRFTATSDGAESDGYGIYNTADYLQLVDGEAKVNGDGSLNFAIACSNEGSSLSAARVTFESAGASNSYGYSGSGDLASFADVEIVAISTAMVFDSPFGLVLERVSATGFGNGIVLRVPANGSGPYSATLLHTEVDASTRGLDALAYAGTLNVTVEHGGIRGTTATVRALDSSVVVAGSAMRGGGPLLEGSGSVTCAGTWDENAVFYPDTCP